MVADHPAEPAALLARVGEVVAEVGRRRDADRQLVRVAAGLLGGGAHVRDRPLQDHRVGELEDEAVGLAPAQRERLRPVAGHPHVELPVDHPRDPDLAGRRLDRAALGELLDDVHRLLGLGQRRRLLAEHAPGGVAAPDAADRAVAEALVERGEQRRGDGRVARRRVRHERADHDPLRRREHLRVDDVRLLPQDVRVERPRVVEAEVLGPLRELDDAPLRRVGLEGDAEVHLSRSPPGAGARRLLRAHQREVHDGGDPEGDEHAVAVQLVEEVRVGHHAALGRRRVDEARQHRDARRRPRRRARASCSRRRTSTCRPARGGRAPRRRAACAAAASSRRPSPRGSDASRLP